MNWNWGSAEDVMEHIRGSQIQDGRIGQNGLYLTLADQRVVVVVCLPNECLGVALVMGEGAVH